jgi:deoxyribonuclease V
MHEIAHDWNLAPKEAIALQRQLREKIDLSPLHVPPRTIAGADISYNRFSDVIYAGVVILDYESMRPLARSVVNDRMAFPYIPGLLSFREIPSLMKAWQALPYRPDIVMVDGQGVAHPRRMGIAAHMGLLTNCPALGCAKKILTGAHGLLEAGKGSAAPLMDKGELVGYALRTKDKVNPVYISAGHLMSQEDALAIALHCTRGYRLPEPTRQAHLTVNAFRRGEIDAGPCTIGQVD